MKKCALVVGNGERPSPELFAELMADAPLLLCADGGANVVVELGAVPDFVVGDLDSVAKALQAELGPQKILRADADNTGTDLQKVLRYARQIGVESATLTGVTGGRSDHTLWNLSLLKVFANDMALRVIDDYCEICLVAVEMPGAGGRMRFRAALGQKVSLSPLGGPVCGVKTQGLKFALCGETLELGVRDGISNEVVCNPVEIGVESGDLLVFIQREASILPVEWGA